MDSREHTPTTTEALELLERLVAIDSQNPGPGEAAIGNFVAEVARGRGFSVEMIEGAPGRPNLIVDVDGGPGRCLAFSGHLDTKPIGDAHAEWRTDPLRLTVVDADAFGLGASDMKGAIATLLIAATRWGRTASAGRVRLVLSCDEEAGSSLGAALLARGGHVKADAMVVAEPSGLSRSWEALHTVSRGMTCFEVTVQARQGHSGLSERLGTSATVAAARMIDRLASFEPSFEPSQLGTSPTVNPAVRIDGGVYYGVHPGWARFASDVRLVPGMDATTFDRELRALLDAASPADVRYELDYEDGPLGWMEAAGIDADHPLVASAQRAAHAVLGRRLPLGACPGATDARFFARDCGIPSIAAFGPGLLSVAHAPNEYVPVADLSYAVDIYERLMTDYLSDQEPV